MKRAFLSRIKRLWGNSQHSRTKGFTLLELLVVTAIGAGIVSGLMFIVVQLMDTDQREASRSETQREMQMALDYISAELREAVYVYTGSQLTSTRGTAVSPLNDFIPASLTSNSIPVLAFWKQQEFPKVARDFCKAKSGTSAADVTARAGINCESGSSYALVVYSIKTRETGDIWQGEARLTRYVLTEFKSSTPLAINKGYVNPGAFANFPIWPVGTAPNGAADTNLQTIRLAETYRGMTPTGRDTGRPDGSADVLVDFVANPTTAPVPGCPNSTYEMSPASSASRSFYACVPPRTNTGDNQEVILFLQGSVNGRPGYTDLGNRTSDKLPTLETRVLTRGVLSRTPATD